MHYQFDIKMEKYVMIMMLMMLVIIMKIWWDGSDDDGCDDNDNDGDANKQQMRHYHDSIIVSCVSYSENTFSHRLISSLDGLSCPVDNDAL